MKYKVVPFGAVTLRSIDSPFLPDPVTPESPGSFTDGGVFWPTPFSRYWYFGGASLFGFAPCALASTSQILQLKSCAAVFGSSFAWTTVNVCGPSSAAWLTMCSVPPDGTVYTSL